jgi:hypothetical protein
MANTDDKHRQILKTLYQVKETSHKKPRFTGNVMNRQIHGRKKIDCGLMEARVWKEG